MLRSLSIGRSLVTRAVRQGRLLPRQSRCNAVVDVISGRRGFTSAWTFEPPVVKRALPPLLEDEDVESSLKQESDSKESDQYAGVKFSSIEGISPVMIDRLNGLGFERAFEVQSETLPHTLKGKDVIGRAITGSGKTLAFAIPVIEKLSRSPKCFHPRAIAIAPTRELCRQVMQSIKSLSGDLKCVALYGGDSYIRQNYELKRGVDVVCATPGRLRDHLQRGSLRLNNVEFLILDEADELLTPNFREQIDDVLHGTPKEKQMMLFSATLPPDIRHLIREHMSDPVVVDLVHNKPIVPSAITHQVMSVDPYSKNQLLVQVLLERDPKRVIVFINRKIWADTQADHLSRNGIPAISLHSDLSQSTRESRLQRFRKGQIKVIVATDVAARGIDIPEIDLVIHIDPPPSGIDYYVHRSGRTGRKGQPGTSLLLLEQNRESEEFLYQLQKLIKLNIVRPPTPEELSKVLMEKVVTQVKKVEATLFASARSHAEELFNTHGVDALASALSCIGYPVQKPLGRGDDMFSQSGSSDDDWLSQSLRGSSGRGGSYRGGSFRGGSSGRGGSFSQSRGGSSGRGGGGSFSQSRGGGSFSQSRGGGSFSRGRSNTWDHGGGGRRVGRSFDDFGGERRQNNRSRFESYDAETDSDEIDDWGPDRN